MLVKDLRNKNDQDLLNLIEDFKAQLFMLRFQNKTGQLDKPHKISQVKKDIAKIFTILNARELKLEKVHVKVTKKVVESKQESKLKKVEEVKSSKKTLQKNVEKKVTKLENKQPEKKNIKKEDK